MRRLTPWITLFLFFGSPACAADTPDSTPPGRPAAAPEEPDAPAATDRRSATDWTTWANRLDGTTSTDRFVQATGLFLGTPYFNGPLGEGDGAAPDPDPRCDLGRVDCVTYLEQSLALALADPGDEASFLAWLDRIRYRDGEVGFASRNHYMVMDWIPANSWLLRDVTEQVGGEHVRRVQRTVDRVKFLQDQGVAPRAGVDTAADLEIAIIPSSAAADVAPALRDGDLIFWVGRVEGIFVLHTGLVVRADGTTGAGGGTVTFRHGSSKAGAAVDEPFVAYAERSTFAEGFLVIRVRDDVSRGVRG